MAGNHDRLALGASVAAVCAAFFAIFLSLQLQSASPTSQDDVYYHIRHSISYCTNAPPIKMPVYSTMNARPADLYAGYHLALCPFAALSPGTGYQPLITGAKIFNSLLNALFTGLFFYLCYKLLRKKDAGNAEALLISLLSTLYLYTASFYFFSRLNLIRPQIFGIAAVCIAYYCIEKKHWKTLGLASFCLPFFYSVSFVVLFPAIAFAIASIIYTKEAVSRETWLPLLISFGSLALGVICHPQFLNYIYNAYFIHLFTIFNRFGNASIVEGTELYQPDLSLLSNFLWIIVLGAGLAGAEWRILKARSLKKALDFSIFYLLIQAFFLMLGFIFIERVIEYFAPFAAFLAAQCFLAGYRRLKKWSSDKSIFPAEQPSAIAAFVSARTEISKHRKAIAIFLFLWFLAMFGKIYFNIGAAARAEPPSDLYQGAALYMAENSQENDIVFNYEFGQYPRLVFFSNKDRYIMGMDATFTYANNPGLYFEYAHIIKGNAICQHASCAPSESIALHSAIRDDFHAKFVFFDRSGADTSDNYNAFFKRVESDSGFKLAFTDPNEPGIQVYEVK